jgi:hypothetical protein
MLFVDFVDVAAARKVRAETAGRALPGGAVLTARYARPPKTQRSDAAPVAREGRALSIGGVREAPMHLSERNTPSRSSLPPTSPPTPPSISPPTYLPTSLLPPPPPSRRSVRLSSPWIYVGGFPDGTTREALAATFGVPLESVAEPVLSGRRWYVFVKLRDNQAVRDLMRRGHSNPVTFAGVRLAIGPGGAGPPSTNCTLAFAGVGGDTHLLRSLLNPWKGSFDPIAIRTGEYRSRLGTTAR